jgi:gliding motility-associated-like protein
VIDVTPPVIAGVPADVVVECNQIPPVATPTATDVCMPNVPLVFRQDTIFNNCLFTLVRTWTATDNCNNRAVATQRVTVLDRTAPAFIGVPASIQVQCFGQVPTLTPPTIRDACDPNATMQQVVRTLIENDCEAIYRYTWYVQDNCGNRDSVSATVTVRDTIAPRIISAPPVQITIECGQPVPTQEPVFADNCDDTLTLTAISGISQLPCGELISRSWTATDDCGNSVTFAQEVRIIDNTPPIITGVPADTLVECRHVPLVARPRFTDNCDQRLDTTFRETITGDTCIYTIRRVWTATDDCGNTAVKTQIIAVVDTSGPELIFLHPALFGLQSGDTLLFQCDQAPRFTPYDVKARDYCDPRVQVQFEDLDLQIGDCLEDGFLMFMWCRYYATDRCGNTTSVEFYVKVIDTTPPVIHGVGVDLALGCHDAIPPAGIVTATDNCLGTVSLVMHADTIPGDCPGAYTIERTWTATDHCLNVGTAVQRIVVRDNTPPVFSLSPISLKVSCEDTIPVPTFTVTDDCYLDIDIYLASEDTVLLDCCPKGFKLERTWAAIDDCGNISTAVQSILIFDEEAPTILGVPANMTIFLALGQAVPPAASVFVYDNCDPDVDLEFTETRLGDDCNYIITRTWTATDNCDNVTVKTQIITVRGAAPVLTMTSTPEFCGNQNGTASVAVSGGTAPYTYLWNTGANTSSIDHLAGGTYSVTVTDASGCVSIGLVFVGYRDPVLSLATQATPATCNSNNGSASVAVVGGTAPYTYLWSTGATSPTITNLAAGSYLVTVTDVHGCAGVASATVTQQNLNLTVNVRTTPEYCHAANGSAFVVTVDNGIGPYSVVWSNGSTGTGINGLTAGSYSLTVTDANGCTGTATATVIRESIDLTVNVQTIPATCNNSDGSATVTSVPNGTGPFRFAWSTGDTTATASNLAAGIYTVTVTDASGCSGVGSGTVQGSTGSIVVNVQTTADTCGSRHGSASALVQGGTAPFTYLWNTGATTSTLTGLGAGSFTVTVTDASGCSGIASGVVVDQVVTLNIGVQTTPDICGSANGTVTTSVTGGTAPYSYQWSNGATTSSISHLTAGTYHLTVTDARGCSATATASVGSRDVSLTVNVQTTPETCLAVNGTATATIPNGTAPFTYLWSTGATTANLTGLTGGIYSVTVTDVNGCTGSGTGIVQELTTSLDLSVQTTYDTCGNHRGTATAVIGGGTVPYTYRWNTGATTQRITGLGLGTYTVTVTDANGCSGIASGSVLDQLVTLNIGIQTTPEICGSRNGTASASVQGGTAPYTYHWSNGATTSSISGLAEGTYFLTVTDANGCKGTAVAAVGSRSINLTVNVLTVPETCNAQNGSASATVLNGTAPYTYLWSNNSTASSITGLTSGTYTVTVTDAIGCTGIGSGFVQGIASTLDVSVQTTPDTCGSRKGTASASVQGGTAPFTYLWSNGWTATTITGLTAGNYTVTVTDASGCSETATAVVTDQSVSFNIGIQTTPEICGSRNGTASATVQGGTAPYTYLWSNGATTSSISGLAEGTYFLTVTDAHGCPVTSTTAVGSRSINLTVNVQTTPETCSAHNGTASSSVLNGTAPYTYLWSNGSTNATATGLTAGTYTVTVSDANGCFSTGEAVVVSQKTNLTVELQASPETCRGANGIVSIISVQNGIGPYSILWSTGATGSAIGGLTAGIYSVTVTDANGCTGSASATVTRQNIDLSVNVQTTPETCDNNNGTASVTNVINGVGPFTYLWSTGGTSATISGLSAGTYSVTVSDVNGCTGVASAVVQEIASGLTVSVQTTPADCGASNGTATAIALGGNAPYTYLWNTGATSTTINNLASGTYTVTVTDASGCYGVNVGFVGNQGSNLQVNVTTTADTCDANDGTATALALGGTAPYTYLWNNGATSSSISNLPAGQYLVTVTDRNGCFGTASGIVQLVTSNLVLSLQATPDSCNISNGTASISVTGGTGPYTYLWNTGSTSRNIQSLSAGLYRVTVTDVNGCSDSGSVVVNPYCPCVLPVVEQTTVTPASCSNNDGTATILMVGNEADFTYSWTPNLGVPNLVGNARTGLPSGNYLVVIHTDGDPDCNIKVEFKIQLDCPPVDCDSLFTFDFVTLETPDTGAEVCLPVKGSISGMQIIVDGVNYTQPTTPCGYDTLVYYTYALLPGGGQNGPYRVDLWAGNGVILSNVIVNHMAELAAIMDANDPSGNWVNNYLTRTLEGGAPNGTYGDLVITHLPTSTQVVMQINRTEIPYGDAVHVEGLGNHTIVLYDPDSGCRDTLAVALTQQVPQPGNFIQPQREVMSINCDNEQAEFCLDDISWLDLGKYRLTDNGNTFAGQIDGCSYISNLSYSVYTVPGFGMAGPYRLDNWSVNGILVSGQFDDVEELIDLMNLNDPDANWRLDMTQYTIRSDRNYGGQYGPLNITQLSTVALTILELNTNRVPSGMKLSLTPGVHNLEFTRLSDGMKDTLMLGVACIRPDVMYDTIYVGDSEQMCLPTTDLLGQVTGLTDLCNEGTEAAVVVIEEGTNCLQCSGIYPGSAKACLVLCDEFGVCDTTYLFIEVREKFHNNANDDTTTTKVNTPVTINPAGNDNLNGKQPKELTVIVQPSHGTVVVNPDFTVTYTPDEGYCNDESPDRFEYKICGELGGCDIAIVYVWVNCSPLVIHTGFSPNGDGINDFFIIDGLERYPSNKLVIFNRWGNEVFRKEGYKNDWGGEWTTRELPDGTYFYFLEDGEGNSHSGYLQIWR